MKKRFKLLTGILVLMLALGTATACNGDTPDESSNSSVAGQVDGVFLNTTGETISIYEKLTLTATTNGVSGAVVWSSSDNATATVENGVVTPLKEGTVTITATVGDYNASCVVVIEKGAQIPVLSVKESIALKVGQEFSLNSALKFGDNTLDATFAYESKNTNVATVSNGKVTAVAIGTTTIEVKATYLGEETTASVAVQVTPDVTFELSELSVVLGTMQANGYEVEQTVGATVYEGTTLVSAPSITWESHNTGVASVNNGLITAVAAGETTVEATYTTTQGVEIIVYVGVSVQKPVFESILDNYFVDFGADNDTAELDLTGLDEESEDVVHIRDKGGNELSFEVIDGKIILNREDVKIGAGSICIETKKALHNVDVRYTCNEYTIMRFENSYDASKVSMFYNGYMEASVDTTVKHGDDLGSLKFTMTSKQDWNAIHLNLLELADISDYDYISFYVYNPTEHGLTVTLMWCGDTSIPANSWGEVRFATKLFDKGTVQDIDGNKYSKSEITTLPLVVYRGEWLVGEAFYISYIKVGKNVIEPGRENIVKPFDREVGSINLPGDHGKAEYTTEKAYGDEAGSLKVTVSKSSEVYISINEGLFDDITGYDYLVYRIFNPTANQIMAGALWCGDTKCPAGEWTEVKIAVSLFEAGSVDAFSGADIPATNIAGFVIRLINGFKPGDVFYISAVKAERNTTPVEEGLVKGFHQSAEDINLPSTHGTAVYTTEQKYGNEAGSLKLTVSLSGEVYLSINTPATPNISSYDYLVFRVYNPTSANIQVGVLWCGDTVCAPGEWTEVKIAVSKFEEGSVVGFSNGKIPATNVAGLVIRFINGFNPGDVFYISAVRAEKNA